MNVECVCFDLDDTLYDYRHYARSGLDAAADYLEDEAGLRLRSELYDLYFIEGNTSGTFDTIIERNDLDEEYLEILVDEFHQATEPLSPYPTTEPVLLHLGDSHRLGLITDGRGGYRKLERLAIRRYFDHVVVTPALGTSKRESSPFEQLLEALGLTPEEVVYVGDDPRVDFRVPNEFGMMTIRIERGRYVDLEPAHPQDNPDLTVESLTEVPKLIE